VPPHRAGTARAGEVALEEVLQGIERRHLGAGALQQIQGARRKQIETLDEEAALVGERGIEAAAADVHGHQQVGQ
jgi:hypothetical protein